MAAVIVAETTISDWATALMVVGVAFCAMVVCVVYVLKTGRLPWEKHDDLR